MIYLILSFVAGILTVLAPCVIPVLPVVLGGSVTSKSWRKPLTIILSLCVSIIIFTLLLKATTLLIDVSVTFWQGVSGFILILFGIITIFPTLWPKLLLKLGLASSADSFLHKAAQKEGTLGDILIGFALGPVFTSCSPTYTLILATILPQSFGFGLLNLVIYAFGLGLILFLITLLGQKLVSKLKWAFDPNGFFRKAIGVLFIILGILIMTGFIKQIETYILDNFDLQSINLEFELLEKYTK